MTTRTRRVGELVLRELGALFQRGRVRDPDIGFVTFTGVDMTPDLRRARVFYSVLGAGDDQSTTQAALDRACPFVRRELGRKLHLKVTPEIEFRIDRSIEHGARIDQLLRDVGVSGAEGENCDDGGDDGGEAEDERS